MVRITSRSLEVIDKGHPTDAHPAPLLFVHGLAHAAWCWDEYFLSFFAERGYRAVAVSLSGHGSSSKPRSLRACSISDYVNDVRSVADSLPSRPVMIGHSMGGFVVQKYLEYHRAPAGILMASIPCGGVYGTALRNAKRHPWLLIKTSLTNNTVQMINTPARAREALFSARTPEADVLRWAARLQNESQRALLDMLFLNLPVPERVTAPLLVLGAECDGSITMAEVQATAHAYGTEAKIFPHMGHDMMLEPGWGTVANRIDDWLITQGL
ncbi:alpha/beta hydrolase [Mycobacterium colombiense]|uniref:alpha/beta hydrolase n=1 Tax=Mycobacterium colombiense TaxID=339268 RepID=UPI0007EF3219|nr:alpha/beta fold hydrolase [Mycobacterium colombiense]OBK63101.1 alpha/beta hydrolase [Mycobacterium colombiense]